jgi:hypothetical protein
MAVLREFTAQWTIRQQSHQANTGIEKIEHFDSEIHDRQKRPNIPADQTPQCA